MDPSNYIRSSEDEFTQANLKGASIYGAGDHKVSTVDHVHGCGSASKVVIDVVGLPRHRCQAGVASDGQSSLHACQKRRDSRRDILDQGSVEGDARTSRLDGNLKARRRRWLPAKAANWGCFSRRKIVAIISQINAGLSTASIS